MIQRIQTIFLILAALCFGALFKLPMLTSTSTTTQFLADNIYSIQDHLILLSITCFAIGVSVLSIFMYKNRKLQRKLVYLVIFLAIALSVCAYFLLKMNSAEALKAYGIHMQAGLFLPLAGMVFCFFAGYYIGKDDKLVKSMDRLR
jgi:uncharacterized membrane protein YwzB